jgi:hypothetical protein
VLNEKHVEATWKSGKHLSIRSWTQGNQEKPVSRWSIAGPSGYWLIASCPASKLKQSGVKVKAVLHQIAIYIVCNLFLLFLTSPSKPILWITNVLINALFTFKMAAVYINMKIHFIFFCTNEDISYYFITDI